MHAAGYDSTVVTSMKFLFDLFPVLVFFLAFKVAGIYAATGAAIAASVGQISWLLLRKRKVDPMLWVSFGIVVIFGGATLLLHDETFIKWKPTVLFWFFGVSLLGGELFFRKNLIRSVMEKQLALPEHVWPWLNRSWAVFFLLLGGLNLYFALNYPTEIWVNFKVIGVYALMFVFVVAQGLMLSKYVVEEKKEDGL